MVEDLSKPSDEFVSNIDVHTLLPQQEPFVMIGKMEHFIAQTCAARIGYVNRYILKKKIQIGFIGAIKNLNVIDLPKVNDEIFTKVEVMEEVFGVILASAEIRLKDKVIVSTEIKIGIKEES